MFGEEKQQAYYLVAHGFGSLEKVIATVLTSSVSQHRLYYLCPNSRLRMAVKIGFIGATGVIGQPVARQMIRAGLDVTIFSRTRSKAERLFPGVPSLQADVANPDNLKAAFCQVNTLYLNLNLDQGKGPTGWQTEKEGLENILQAAKATGIQKIGFISSIVMRYQGMNGFNWWVFELKKQAVEKIKDAGIPYLIFYPSTFMESIPYIYKQGRWIMLAGESRQPMWFVAGDDYGRQVAAAFKKIQGNAEFTIQGPEPFTADEAAHVFIQNYRGAKLSIARAPLGFLKLAGKISHKVSYGAHIIEALNNYPEKFESEGTWALLGKPQITLKAFAEEQA